MQMVEESGSSHGMRNEMTRSHYLLPGNDGGTRRVDQAMLPLHQNPIVHAHCGSISRKKHYTGTITPCTKPVLRGAPASDRIGITVHEGLLRFSSSPPTV